MLKVELAAWMYRKVVCNVHVWIGVSIASTGSWCATSDEITHFCVKPRNQFRVCIDGVWRKPIDYFCDFVFLYIFFLILFLFSCINIWTPCCVVVIFCVFVFYYFFWFYFFVPVLYLYYIASIVLYYPSSSRRALVSSSIAFLFSSHFLLSLTIFVRTFAESNNELSNSEARASISSRPKILTNFYMERHNLLKKLKLENNQCDIS